jgi:hypothetical protein
LGRSSLSVEVSGQKDLMVRSNPLNSITKTYQFDRLYHIPVLRIAPLWLSILNFYSVPKQAKYLWRCCGSVYHLKPKKIENS